MISIKDIANRAGVSQSTVSKALNNRPDVSENTKKRVLEIVKRLNYTPHAFGKALKKKTSENVGVIFCRYVRSLSGNPFYSRVLEGIETELAVNNYNLILQIITESNKDELPKMLREQQVDGLILVGTFKDGYLNRILDSGINIVMIDPHKIIKDCCKILIDNEHGAFQAIKYLIDRGHRRIGFISGDLSRLSFQQRYDGYKKALKLNTISLDKNIVHTGGLENGYEQVKYLIEEHNVRCIFSANDLNAIYGYKAINELNLKVPDDVSIVGFDDIDMARMSSPPLTTVRVYKEELGSIAVRILLKLVQGEAENNTTTIVPTRFVERESVNDLNINRDLNLVNE